MKMADRVKRVESIIRDAGGQVIGGTKLQKIAYLLELADLGGGYNFRYHYFGPYSEELATETKMAWAFDVIEKEERPSTWGGTYSVFRARGDHTEGPRSALAQAASEMDAVELELAATAAFLSTQGYADPWEETRRRKPDKATKDRMRAAKAAYQRLRRINVPRQLPDIA